MSEWGVKGANVLAVNHCPFYSSFTSLSLLIEVDVHEDKFLAFPLETFLITATVENAIEYRYDD